MADAKSIRRGIGRLCWGKLVAAGEMIEPADEANRKMREAAALVIEEKFGGTVPPQSGRVTGLDGSVRFVSDLTKRQLLEALEDEHPEMRLAGQEEMTRRDLMVRFRELRMMGDATKRGELMRMEGETKNGVLVKSCSLPLIGKVPVQVLTMT